MARPGSTRVVAAVLALSLPVSAWTACGSALLTPPSRHVCPMTTSNHCESSAGVVADCCASDHETPRHQVVQTIAQAPGKPLLGPLDAVAPACPGECASARHALDVALLKLPRDRTYLRHSVLLI